jgi:VIT1/CCC1 family predicted Fe2+/Mn2+ transporter
VVLTLVALFGAGATKTLITGRPWARSGVESMLIGALAACATFLAGRWIAPGS